MITFENVAYGYGDKPLFSDLNLTLEQGSFHFLTGPSGAGKTTLLRLCYADLQAHTGEVRLFGAPASTLDRDGVAMLRRRIGVVHQDCQFLDHLTISENIAMPLIVAGRGAQAAGNLEELLRWVGLGRQAGQRPQELSGGERQRAALARAVIMAPDVIIADEPTGNVDLEMSMRLLSLLIELNRMGKTVLIATHDMPMIRSVKADVNARILRLQGGSIMQAGAEL